MYSEGFSNPMCQATVKEQNAGRRKAQDSLDQLRLGQQDVRFSVVDAQVTLRPVTEEDLKLLVRLFNDPAASGEHEWHGWRDTRWLRRRWEENSLLGEEGGTLIVTKGDDALGFVSWSKRPYGYHSSWVIGIGLKPEARGLGHGTQAQRLTFSHTQVNSAFAVMPLRPPRPGGGRRFLRVSAGHGEMP
jgi:RimJ/RimL family protein N-acetyltransferase